MTALCPARPAQGDHTTGLAMVGAILGALRVAEKTGQGQAVETSLYETAVWTQATDYSVTAMDHAPVRRRPRHQMLAICANRFPCGDGKWVVFNMMPDAAYWPRLVKCLDCEELLEDPRFVDPSSRYKNMAVLIDLIDNALSVKSRDEWGKIFDEAGLIWGPVMGLRSTPRPTCTRVRHVPENQPPRVGRLHHSEYSNAFCQRRCPASRPIATVGPTHPAGVGKRRL